MATNALVSSFLSALNMFARYHYSEVKFDPEGHLETVISALVHHEIVVEWLIVGLRRRLVYSHAVGERTG